ncbi:MAG: glycosyltransferase family 2 protein [Polynucleobacter sp.]
MIYIIVLNWNGWQDTLECLESLLKLEFANYRVIVCDNYSQDDSEERIGQWLKQLPAEQSARFTLLQTGENRGYGPGNNVGIRLALQDPLMEAVWILNNDVVVDSRSLHALYQYHLDNPKRGLIGSKLMFYTSPTQIQAVGGQYNRFFASSTHLGEFEIDHGQYDQDEISTQIDYPVGAALFVTRAYLESVGLLAEEYFLYFEEIDWATRGALAGWQLGYCYQSRVFHKEGGSTGANANPVLKSYLSDYYSVINRVRFTRKFYRANLWSVKLGLLIAGANRIRRGQFDRLKIIFKALAS